MLHSNTFLVDRGAPLPPAVVVMVDDAVALFYAALERAENVYGVDAAAVRSVLQRHLVDGAVAFHHLYSPKRAEAVALDATNSDAIRAFAAALALNRALPGADGAAPPKSDDNGGTKARLSPPKPRRPPGGATVNPFAALGAA